MSIDFLDLEAKAPESPVAKHFNPANILPSPILPDNEWIFVTERLLEQSNNQYTGEYEAARKDLTDLGLPHAMTYATYVYLMEILGALKNDYGSEWSAELMAKLSAAPSSLYRQLFKHTHVAAVRTVAVLSGKVKDLSVKGKLEAELAVKLLLSFVTAGNWVIEALEEVLFPTYDQRRFTKIGSRLLNGHASRKLINKLLQDYAVTEDGLSLYQVARLQAVQARVSKDPTDLIKAIRLALRLQDDFGIDMGVDIIRLYVEQVVLDGCLEIETPATPGVDSYAVKLEVCSRAYSDLYQKLAVGEDDAYSNGLLAAEFWSSVRRVLHTSKEQGLSLKYRVTKLTPEKSAAAAA